jgi:hypothetical protein
MRPRGRALKNTAIGVGRASMTTDHQYQPRRIGWCIRQSACPAHRGEGGRVSQLSRALRTPQWRSDYWRTHRLGRRMRPRARTSTCARFQIFSSSAADSPTRSRRRGHTKSSLESYGPSEIPHPWGSEGQPRTTQGEDNLSLSCVCGCPRLTLGVQTT